MLVSSRRPRPSGYHGFVPNHPHVRQNQTRTIARTVRKELKFSGDFEILYTTLFMILHELVYAFPIFVQYYELFHVVTRNPRYTAFPFLTVRRHFFYTPGKGWQFRVYTKCTQTCRGVFLQLHSLICDIPLITAPAVSSSPANKQKITNGLIKNVQFRS